MNIDDAIMYIASKIKKYGETYNGCGCLVPTRFEYEKPTEFNEASDILSREFNATHYSCIWVENNMIKLSLFQNEAFGASQFPMKLVKEFTLQEK